MRPVRKARPAGRSSGRSATPNAPFGNTTHSDAPASRSVQRNTPTRPAVDYKNVEVPNARWHEEHTFTCFAYPTFGEDDMHQIAAALVKVIRAFSKKAAVA